jgi:hypothetical protein
MTPSRWSLSSCAHWAADSVSSATCKPPRQPPEDASETASNTPVSGSVNSTCPANSWSPAISANTVRKVAGARAVVPVVLEMVEKRRHQFRIEIGPVQDSRWLARLLLREAEQQLERIRPGARIGARIALSAAH